MRGSNTLLLNGATMIDAVQEYLDKRLTPKIEVVSVTSTGSSAGEFKVDVKEITEEARS